MVVVEAFVCGAAGLCFAKRAKSQGLGTPQKSERLSSVEDRERIISFDGGSTTATTASSSSVCRMLDDVLEMSPHLRPESFAGTSHSSFDSVAPVCALFVCTRCAQGIAEDEPVHMCGDAAYCSRECRDDVHGREPQLHPDEWHVDPEPCAVTPLRARAASVSSLSLLYTSAFEDFD